MKNAGIKNSMTIAAFVNKSDLPDFELPDVLITDEISMAEIHLSPSDCLLWQQEITQLHTRIREHGVEY